MTRLAPIAEASHFAYVTCQVFLTAFSLALRYDDICIGGVANVILCVPAPPTRKISQKTRLSMPGNTPQPPRSGLTALIIEDHAEVRASLRESIGLAFPDLRLIEAENGKDAIKLALAELPQLVLMDIGLPGMDGIEAMRQIKIRLPGACFIVVSVQDNALRRARASEAGAAAFIPKRRIRTELVATLESVVPRLVPGSHGRESGIE